MNVLLIQPPIEDYYTTDIRTYPHGLCSIAAAVRPNVRRVDILDCRTGVKTHRLPRSPFPELDDYFRSDASSPFALFSHFSRFGLSEEAIIASIAAAKADLIGIASLFSAYHHSAIRVAEIARIVSPGTPIVMGGVHPTLFPDNVLQNPAIDYVVRGEGEDCMLKLVKHLCGIGDTDLHDIPGLCFRDERGEVHIGEITELKDIDRFPARDILPQDTYRMFGKPYAVIMTTRGCPRNCSFCGRPPGTFRRRGLRSLDAEFSSCREAGIEILDFEDDMLNEDRDHFHHVLDLLSRYPFECYAMNGLNPRGLEAADMKPLVRAGFKKLNVSLVDSHTRRLEEQNRGWGARVNTLFHHFEQCPELLYEVHFIVGLPGQQEQDLLDLIVSLMSRRILLGPSIYYPVPGSKLWTDYQTEMIACRSSVMNPVAFDRDTIVTILKLVRFVNACKRIVDKAETSLNVNDLIRENTLLTDERQRVCFKELISAHRFVAINRRSGEIVPERQRPELVELFFNRSRNHHIRGFKTENILSFP